MQGRIQHPRRSEMISRIVPFTRLAGDSQFQIVMRFVWEWQKHAETRAADRVAVQICHRAVGSETHVSAQIQRARHLPVPSDELGPFTPYT